MTRDTTTNSHSVSSCAAGMARRGYSPCSSHFHATEPAGIIASVADAEAQCVLVLLALVWVSVAGVTCCVMWRLRFGHNCNSADAS